MSLKRDIQSAYDQVHAPEDAIKRMKRELREKDLRGIEESSFTPEAPRPQFWRYAVYVAAVFAVFGCGVLAWHSVQDKRVDLHPGSQVQETVQTNAVPDLTGMQVENARMMLEQAGWHIEIYFEGGSVYPAKTVIRTEQRSEDVIRLYVSNGE